MKKFNLYKSGLFRKFWTKVSNIFKTSTISDKILLLGTTFPCKFNSPQVKRNLIFHIIN